MWVWVVVAAGVIGLAAAVASAVVLMKGGKAAAPPAAADIDDTGMPVNNIDDQVQVVDAEMQILDGPSLAR